jgi:hypothetical protein
MGGKGTPLAIFYYLHWFYLTIEGETEEGKFIEQIISPKYQK